MGGSKLPNMCLVRLTRIIRDIEKVKISAKNHSTTQKKKFGFSFEREEIKFSRKLHKMRKINGVFGAQQQSEKCQGRST